MDSQDIRRVWAERTGAYSPEYYAYYGPNETSEAVGGVLAEHLDADATVLEVGCASGRHLAHLHEAGFTELHGLDVNPDAFDVLADTYPDLDAAGTFHAGTIGEVVPTFETDRFDAVYSVETLQHVPPTAEGTFDELARVAGDLLVTVENEGREEPGDEVGTAADDETDDGTPVNYVDDEFPLYYRDWHEVFAERGMVEVEREPTRRDTLRAFVPDEE